jgi:peptidoglycan-associated lipoprotein
MSARQRRNNKEEKAAIGRLTGRILDMTVGFHRNEALNLDGQWLKNHPKAVMRVEGHCDERGTLITMCLGG